MPDSMEDVLGRKLEVGDYVAYGDRHVTLSIGKVVKIAAKTVRVASVFSDKRESVYPNSLIKVFDQTDIDNIEKKIVLYLLRKEKNA